MAALCWINPLSWLLLKEIRLNLEYMADKAAIPDEQEKKTYQYLLLDISQSNKELPSAIPFNYSFLKTRIRMINRKRSQTTSVFKYLLILPLFLAIVTANQCCTDQQPLQSEIEKVFPKSSEVQTKDSSTTASETSETPLDVAEIMPEFPGGTEALLSFIKDNLEYPQKAIDEQTEGRVIIRFVVTSVFAAGLYCLTLKEPVAPQEEYIKSAEASKDKKLPSVGTSLAPIILPLVLIFLNTGINAMFPDTTVAKVFKFVGSPLAALLAGCLFSLVLTGAEWRSKKVMNDWVESALRSSAMPIMVTAMGGALAAFIKNAGVANAVAETVVQFSIPGIIIPILIAALIHVITGSNALGVMTAAALVEPMLGALGISPLAAFLACGTGALMFKHANSSGFWVTVTMSNMDIRQGIRAVGGGSTVAGFTGAAITVILHFAGII